MLPFNFNEQRRKQVYQQTHTHTRKSLNKRQLVTEGTQMNLPSKFKVNQPVKSSLAFAIMLINTLLKSVVPLASYHSFISTIIISLFQMLIKAQC